MNCMDYGGSECICASSVIIRNLTEACQLFTQSIGDASGYIPSLGATKTAQALKLMRLSKVEPVFYGHAATRAR